jgi:hypothetical protein
MKKIVTALSALLISASVMAANTAVLSWTGPTTYSDGSPIVGPVGYNIYQGVQGQPKVKVGTATTTGATISTGLNNATIYCWTVTATQAALESAPSNEACKTFPAIPTAAPTGLTVN